MKSNFELSYERIAKIFLKKGYRLFTGANYDINLIGIRAKESVVNAFDDLFVLLYRDNDHWNLHRFQITTDPGKFWLNNLMNPGGTAIMQEGQYRSAYTIGKHYNTDAFVQVAPVRCYRDANRDNVIDMNPNSVTEGLYGINIHRAIGESVAPKVEKQSAGCQVFQRATELDFVLGICAYAQREHRHPPYFTYTLLNEDDFSQ